MKVEKFIKTECGLEKYHKLNKEKNKSLFHLLKLYLYILNASIRDIFK